MHHKTDKTPIAKLAENLSESVPRKRQIIRCIRGTVAILIEVRVLIAELMFTAAALYGCYIAYKFLVHRVL